MATIRSQADQRRYATYRDQHGRKWGSVVEKETGDPVGAIMPLFEAPFFPPPHVVRVVPGETGLVEIHYDELVRELQDAHEQFRNSARDYAVLMYGAEAAHALETMPRELRHMVGNPPMAIEPALAARQGNKYVLGFSDQMPKWAEKFFGEAARRERERTVEQHFPDAEEEELEQREELGDDITGGLRTTGDDDVDPLEDLNEEFDPDAVGGTRVPVGAARGRRRGKAREDRD